MGGQVATSPWMNCGGTKIEHSGRWQYVRSSVSNSIFFAWNCPASSAARNLRFGSSGIGSRQHRGGNSASSSMDARKRLARQPRQEW